MMDKHTQGTAYWRYDDSVNCWYVGLSERSSPPYPRQVVVEVVLDLDDSGRLAGIELVTPLCDGSPILPPRADLEDLQARLDRLSAPKLSVSPTELLRRERDGE